MATLFASPKEVSFPAQDGGVVYADLYGAGNRCVVLAHGMKFDKASWKEQATQLADAGFQVAAIDFRGYGKSHGGPNSQSPRDLYLDVLAAVDYLRGHGATDGRGDRGEHGRRRVGERRRKEAPGTIDRLILLAPVPIESPERITVPKLYATAQGDPITVQVKEQYAKAPEPKEMLLLEGSAHAQFLFTTDQKERLMKEILRFLSAAKPAASR